MSVCHSQKVEGGLKFGGTCGSCLGELGCHPEYVHHFTPLSRHDLPSPAVTHG